MSSLPSGPPQLSRVLFADDDREVRDAVARVLRSRGLIVDLAGDGYEALVLATEYPYAVIATDHRMPGMSGLDLVQRLRTIQPDASFLVVSGQADARAKFARAPFVSAILSKPWDDRQLVTLIEKGIRDATRRREYRTSPTRPYLPAVGDFALLVEHDDDDARVLEQAITEGTESEVRVVRARTLAEASEHLSRRSYSVVFADPGLPDANGLSALKELQALAADTPLLVVTRGNDEFEATGAVRSGAQDYLVKGRFTSETVLRAMRHAMERKRIETRLATLAYHDALTGLANRTLLADRMKDAISRASRSGAHVGPLCVDLDQFKAVNDTHGHEVGDRLLVEVSRRLTSSTRSVDTVARVGGDEFAILLDGLDEPSSARRVAQRILNAFATQLVIDGKIMPVTPSIGMAFYPRDSASAEELQRHADAALYEAKNAGRNRYCFFARDLHEREVHRQRLERGLREAIAHNRFGLAFQPRLRTRDGALSGYEAFLRWLPKGGQPMAAGAFLGVLDEMGEIVKVGKWALREVCARVQARPDDGQRISLNVSAREVSAPGFVDVVGEVLEDAGVRGDQIELELPESALSARASELGPQLALLAELGVAVAVDAYGAGTSSLFALSALPISTLKLHKGAIASLDDARQRAALRAVIDAGAALGWTVVATCVETAEQFDVLQSLGCPEAQGWFWGAPTFGHLPGPPAPASQSRF